MPISVLLVDDHKLFRESLRGLLEATTDFAIVGEAGNGMEGQALAENLRPDVVVMDCAMPTVNGLEATLRLRKKLPDTYVVILSMHDEESYVSSAIQNGASGYILKDDVINHLKQAVTVAVAGKLYFSPSIRERVSQLELANAAA
jgi:DNA-binding NarL/FixJ family response regulator